MPSPNVMCMQQMNGKSGVLESGSELDPSSDEGSIYVSTAHMHTRGCMCAECPCLLDWLPQENNTDMCDVTDVP
jgi:hypothetical protein